MRRMKCTVLDTCRQAMLLKMIRTIMLVTYVGMQGRQYLASNILTLKFDKGFADEEDRIFVLNIDYYDYGGRKFYVEYMPRA